MDVGTQTPDPSAITKGNNVKGRFGLNTQPPVREFAREYNVVSVVYLYEPIESFKFELNQPTIEQIEEEMDGSLQATHTSVGDINTWAIAMPAHFLDVIIAPPRIEVRSLGLQFSNQVAQQMLRFIGYLSSLLPEMKLKTVGHNFVVPLTAQDGPAVRAIQSKLLKTSLEKQLGMKVLGATAHLWIEAEDGTMRLRFEASRNSITTRRFTANANLSLEIESGEVPPNPEETVLNLVKYCRRLDSVLNGLGL